MELPMHVKLEAAGHAPRFHLGVDGGGTGTRLRLAEANGAEIGFGEAGPSALGQGIAQAWSFHAPVLLIYSAVLLAWAFVKVKRKLQS